MGAGDPVFVPASYELGYVLSVISNFLHLFSFLKNDSPTHANGFKKNKIYNKCLRKDASGYSLIS